MKAAVDFRIGSEGEHQQGKDDEEERKIDEIPVDDGSPVNISHLLYACASAKVFRHYSAMFLFFYVIPFLLHIDLALDGGRVIVTRRSFLIFDMTQTGHGVIFIILYLIIPLLRTLTARPQDLIEDRARVGKLFQVKSSSAILSLSTVILSPHSMILLPFIRYMLIRPYPRLIILLFILIPASIVMIFFSGDKPLLVMINPFVWFAFTATAPFLLLFTSFRFVIKMWGYIIVGLIYNAEIAAPIAVFFATLATCLRDCYFDLNTKCKRVKEIISQEWQQGIKYSLKKGKLQKQEKPKVVRDTIPKKLFWYVCDGDENQVFSLKSETLRLLGHLAIIFCTASLALRAIFLSTNSYQISTVAPTIAVFVSAKLPKAFLRETDNFNGWEKIKTKRIIRESVGTYIDEKKWLQPADEAMVRMI